MADKYREFPRAMLLANDFLEAL